jgi:hypothetical protein
MGINPGRTQNTCLRCRLSEQPAQFACLDKRTQMPREAFRHHRSRADHPKRRLFASESQSAEAAPCGGHGRSLYPLALPGSCDRPSVSPCLVCLWPELRWARPLICKSGSETPRLAALASRDGRTHRGGCPERPAARLCPARCQARSRAAAIRRSRSGRSRVLQRQARPIRRTGIRCGVAWMLYAMVFSSQTAPSLVADQSAHDESPHECFYHQVGNAGEAAAADVLVGEFAEPVISQTSIVIRSWRLARGASACRG